MEGAKGKLYIGVSVDDGNKVRIAFAESPTEVISKPRLWVKFTKIEALDLAANIKRYAKKLEC